MTNDAASGRFVGALLRNRGTVVELVLVAVGLSLGVNFLSSGIPPLLGLSQMDVALIGGTVLGLSLVYLTLRLFAGTKRSVRLEAVFPYDNTKNAVLRIEGYEFAERIQSYFDAAFTENKALRSLWDQEPLRDRFRFDSTSGTVEQKPLKSVQLVREAVEYFIITQLSTHLADYFNQEKFDESRLIELQREDVPDVLLRNRFMELFSRPMEERPAFVQSAPDLDGHVVIAQFGDGVMYERFDLILPKGSRVRRLSATTVEIITSRMRLRFSVRFGGMSGHLPFDFTRKYMGADPKDVQEFAVAIDVEVVFPAWALLTPTGWQYFSWIDSFLDSLERGASAERFLARIDWDSLEALLRLVDSSRLRSLITESPPQPDGNRPTTP